MRFEVRLKPSAAAAVKSLPKADQRRVVVKIEALGEDPRPPGCRKLAGSDDFYRIRVGNHRVVYTVKDRILLVLIVRVAHRREAYRGS